MTIVAPNGTPHGNRYDVTKDTQNCPANYAEGQDCDPTAYALCELGKNVVCHCDGTDMCAPKKGTLTCTYAPETYVVATFDRLLDTTPFDEKKTVATLMPVSANMGTADGGVDGTTADAGANPDGSSADGGPTVVLPVAATDYTSSGSSMGLVFTQWSAPAFSGGYFADIVGPTVAMTGSPALPSDSTVTFQLDSMLVRAKDGKTPFAGEGLLADGKVSFKTASFAVSGVAVPTPPAPMDMGGGSTPMEMGCPDAGTTMDMDASVPEGGADGGSDAAAAETGSDGGVDVAIDVPAVVDAGTDASSGSDAGTTPPPTDVQADMNMGAITITFTNPVDMSVLDHITMTEDGKPFTDFAPDAMLSFPTDTVVLKPKTMWAAGKTYTITVDKDAADLVGDTLGAPTAPTSFTMSAK